MSSGRIEVEMPDGAVIDAPEGTTRAEIAAKWEKLNSPTGGQESLRRAKLLGSSLVRGLAGLPALGIDAANAAARAMSGEGKGEAPFRATNAVSNFGEQPQGVAEGYLNSALQGLSGGLIGPGVLVAPLRSMAVSGAAGLGSEAAASAFGDNAVSRLLGGLAGGGAAGIGSSLSKTREGFAQEIMRGVKPEDARAGADLMRQGQSAGVSLNLAEAMPVASNLDKAIETLAQSRHGEETMRLLRDQPKDVAMLAEREIMGLPGAVRASTDAATNLQAAASGAIDALKGERTKLWQDTLAKATKALEDSKQPGINAAAGEVQAKEAARKALEGRLPALQQAVALAEAGDAAAVKAANAAVEAVRQRISQLETFTLPRGKAETNRGSLLELPGRGASIDLDRSTREGQASALRQTAPPTVVPAPSLATTTAQKDLAQLEGKVTTARQAEIAAAKGLEQANAALVAIGKLPEPVIGGEINRLRQLAARTPNTPKAALLNQLANDLMVKGKPQTDPVAVNEVFKATGAKLTQPNLSTPGLEAGTVKFVQSQLEKTRQRLGDAFTPYRQANAAYEAFTEGTLNPVRASVIARIGGRAGFDASKEMAPARMTALFDAGTVPGATKSEILTLEKAVRGQPNGPEAFQDAVKTWMQTKAKAAVKGEGGRTGEDAAQRLVSAFFATETQRKGLEDTMVALAKSKGLPETTFAPGMGNAMQIIRAATHRPGVVAGTTARQMEEAAKNKLVRAGESFSLIQPFRQISRAVNDALHGDAYRFVDKLINSPEGVETLIKLGKQPVMSRAAVNTLATFLGTAGAGTANLPAATP